MSNTTRKIRMFAKFNSRCVRCAGSMRKGERIIFSPGKGSWHTGCDSATREEARKAFVTAFGHTCDVCSKPAVEGRQSVKYDHLDPLFACEDHARHLEAWVSNLDHEVAGECYEARMKSEYEMDYYSGNE